MKLYDVIYADPPWRYEREAPVKNDRIESHYPTMSEEEIASLIIPAKSDSVLWLWSTSPKLKVALKIIINIWNFEYVTCGVWDKGSPGLGYWFRQQHELLLIGKRGNFRCPHPDTISSVIYCKRGKHSEKPFIIRDYLTRIYKGMDKIEFFARINDYLFADELSKEWDFIGNEA